MEPKTAAIKTGHIAYTIGFSSSLSPTTWSGYNEISKWLFEGERSRVLKLRRKFLSGYEAGTKMLKEVKQDLVASKGIPDRA